MQAVVFTHLIVNERAAFGGTKPLEVWVEEQWKGLFQRFEACRNIKLVYLFLSNAYQAKLVAVHDPSAHFRAISASQKEGLLRVAIEDYLARWKHTRKFVLVGLNELLELLDPMAALSKNSGADLNSLFLGGGQQIFYDCPKVVEALIRIARRNTDPESPILRFDEDVSVTEGAVDQLIAEFRKQRNQRLYYFFSGNYQFHRSDPEDHLLNDFSIRVHFLSSNGNASLNSYLKQAGLPTDGSAFTSQAIAIEQALRDKLADPFHLDLNAAQGFIDLIQDHGANLRNQPISGAGLCISPMAIVQLPPFANVATNIVWIDDALKQQLHLGIGDLLPNQICTVLGASFEQKRHGEAGVRLKDVLWGYTSYLPRLVLGCLFYALMYNLIDADRQEPFAASFAKYIRTRRKPTRGDRRAWAQAARQRLDHLAKALRDHPFASHPVWKPLVALAKHELIFDRSRDRKIIESIIEEPEEDVAKLYPAGRNAGTYIAEVISDLHRYIELVDLWPYIVRTIDFLVRDAPPNHWLCDPNPL